MNTETDERSRLIALIDGLRAEVARLGDRLSAIEARVSPPAPVAPSPDTIDDNVVLVISAAIAAYLGKKPHIQQIRLLGSAAWAQEGRITIQASHAL